MVSEERVQVAVDPGQAVGVRDRDDGARARVAERNHLMPGQEGRSKKMRADKAGGAGDKNPVAGFLGSWKIGVRSWGGAAELPQIGDGR